MSIPSLEGKVAVVTGGGQGIGRGIVRRLLEEGMSVVIERLMKMPDWRRNPN